MPSLSQELERSRHFPHPQRQGCFLFTYSGSLHPTHFTLKLLPGFHTHGSSLKGSPVLEEGKPLYLIKMPEKGSEPCPQATAGTEHRAAETYI